ncbi:MAG: DegQ family serine endoprotease [Gammaproteobacteria bacterium]|nr:DegQ family serine endoprotease [Gammaproteobacteria bacterium]
MSYTFRSDGKHVRHLVLAVMAAGTLLAAGLAQAKAMALPDFAQMIKAHSPAVVSIRTTVTGRASDVVQGLPFDPNDPDVPEFLKRFFGQMPNLPQMPQPQAHGIGSGFLISPDGYIVTNAHVVRDADDIVVGLSDRRELRGTLVGADDRTDIALVKIDADGLPTVTLGDSNGLEVGEWVLAIGAPFGFEYTATQGIVSALSRTLPDGEYTPFIQTDVAVNPGNSGGPLFDLDGHVIGVNSQIFSRTGGYMGVSFAIPSNIVRDVVAQLREHGSVSRGWLGVSIQDLDQQLAQSFGMDQPRGALIAGIEPKGPAAQAGLRPGDVVMRFDGHDIGRAGDLPPLVGAVRPGNAVKVEVLRDGKSRNLAVTIAALSNDGQNVVADAGKAQETGKLGIVVADRPQDAGGGNTDGVVITDVDPRGAAAQAGIRKDDVIVSFNNQRIDSAAALAHMVDQVDAGKSVALLVMRNGTPQFVAVKIPAAVS